MYLNGQLHGSEMFLRGREAERCSASKELPDVHAAQTLVNMFPGLHPNLFLGHMNLVLLFTP
jgi:hypothetical protein